MVDRPVHVRLVLVVDQFEEVSTLSRNENERRAFIDALLHAASAPGGRLVLITAMRADFYARAAAYGELATAIQDHQALVRPMNEAELRTVIEGPAERVGLVLEPGLAELILADVAEEPGALPLLSHALFETWRRRHGRTLTVAEYADAGGVRESIARRAEQVYSGFAPAQQTIARAIFLRLTELGEGTDDTRRRARRDELTYQGAHPSAVADVLKALVAARLVTVGEDSVEVAHEALIREWPTLRGWLDEDREGLRTHASLRRAAREWIEFDRDPGSLYRRGRLLTAGEWAAGHEDELNEQEREFLTASRAAEQAEAEAARRRTRRLRVLAAALGLLLAAAVALGILAVVRGREAQAQARDSRSRRLAAVATANLDRRHEVALPLALEAYRSSHTFEARSALLAAEQRSEDVMRAFAGPADAVSQDVALSPDGRTLAVASNKAFEPGIGGGLQLWDVSTGRPEGASLLRGAEPTSVAFSPDGKTLAAAVRNKVKFVDVTTSHVLAGKDLLTRGERIDAVDFGRDGTTLVASSSFSVRVFSVLTGQPVGARRERVGSLDAVHIGPAAALTPVATRRGVRLMSNAYGRLVGRPLEATREASFASAAVSPDGTTFAAADESGAPIRFWDVRTGLRRTTTSGAGTNADYAVLAFSPDGRTVAALDDEDGLNIRIWLFDVATGQALGPPLKGASGQIDRFAFSLDGTALATSSDDGTIRIWKLTRRSRLLISPFGRPLLGRVDQDGRTLAARTTRDGLEGPIRIWLWNLARGSALSPIVTRLPVSGGVSASPDGKTLAIGRGNGDIWLWDVARRRLKGSITGAPQQTVDVAFAPDGRTLADVSRSGAIRLWRVGNRRRIGSMQGDGPLRTVALGPHGLLAAGSEDGTIELWNTRIRHRIGQPLEGPPLDVTALAFAADGRTLAAAGEGGTKLQLWDVAAQRQLGEAMETSMVDATLGFTDDGKTLVVAGNSDNKSTVLVRFAGRALWEDDSGALTARGCALATRNLTHSEWNEFILDESYNRTCNRLPPGS